MKVNFKIFMRTLPALMFFQLMFGASSMLSAQEDSLYERIRKHLEKPLEEKQIERKENEKKIKAVKEHALPLFRKAYAAKILACKDIQSEIDALQDEFKEEKAEHIRHWSKIFREKGTVEAQQKLNDGYQIPNLNNLQLKSITARFEILALWEDYFLTMWKAHGYDDDIFREKDFFGEPLYSVPPYER